MLLQDHDKVMEQGDVSVDESRAWGNEDQEGTRERGSGGGVRRRREEARLG